MGRNIVFAIGREAATAAKASALSLQSLGTCSNFQTEKLSKRCFTREAYFAIRGSRDSNSSLTCPTINWESLITMSLLADMEAASSILNKRASYSDSLLEALKPNRIAYCILSSVGDFNCRPIPVPVCLDAPIYIKCPPI